MRAAFIFVLRAHELAKCIKRKLNDADFQCNHKGNYTLNVKIDKLKQAESPS